MEEKTRADTEKFREDVEKKINSFIKDDKSAKLEFPPLEKFQVCRLIFQAIWQQKDCVVGGGFQMNCTNFQKIQIIKYRAKDNRSKPLFQPINPWQTFLENIMTYA